MPAALHRKKEGLGQPVWAVAELFPAQGDWTAEAYLALPGERRAELAHGHLEFLPVPTDLHQTVLFALALALYPFAHTRGLGKVLPAGTRVQLGPDQFRDPDVVFLRAENLHRIADRYWQGADLVMEVVSAGPEDRNRDLVVKRREYARAGIAEYWIVDPQEGWITVLVLGRKRYRVHGRFGRGERATSATLPGFEVDVAAVLSGEQA